MPPITEEQKNQDVQDIIQDGYKGAATTCALTSLVVFAAGRYCPWAKANINYAGKTFIISALTAASFAFSAEQSMVKKHRGHERLGVKIGQDFIFGALSIYLARGVRRERITVGNIYELRLKCNEYKMSLTYPYVQGKN